MTPPTADSSDVRFERHQCIGTGGMGEVYACTDRTTGQRVAVKTFRRRDAHNLVRLKREFRTLRDIQHRNLVRLFELHADDDGCFFTMELVEGRDYHGYVCPDAPAALAEGSLAEPTAGPSTATSTQAADASDVSALPSRAHIPCEIPRLRDATAQLVTALSYLHAAGRLHCDVKPSNVLVDADGRVVLLDLGIARPMLPTGEAEHDTLDQIAGTLAYMAPEHTRGGSLTAASDLYAIGVMLYEALAGRRPFAGPRVQVLAEKRRGPARAPSELAEDVPTDLDVLCMALLDPRPERRPDATAVIAALTRSDDAGDVPALEITVQRSHEFVGRSGALAELSDELERSRSSARFVLLRGDPGTGKTALARRFVQTVPEPALVLAGRCHERELVPLNAFDGIMDSLGRVMTAEHVAGLADVDRAAVLRLFPALSISPALGTVAEDVRRAMLPQEARIRAVAVLRQILSDLSRERPLVLFIDDIQWADAGSLEFWSEMLSGDPPIDAVWVATCRTAEPGESTWPDRLTSAVPALGDMLTVIDVGRLTHDESEQLLRVAAPRELSADACKQLALQAGGHPLLLEELARARHDSGGYRTVSTLEEVLLHRLDALSPAERRVVDATCLAGTPMHLPDLANALEMSELDTAMCVQTLTIDQLLRVDAHTHGKRLRPYHDRVRECAEHALRDDDAARANLHAGLGRVLAAASAGGRRQEVFAAARHLSRVLELADHLTDIPTAEDVAELNLRAAKQAHEATAYATALEHTRAGIRQLGDDGWRTARDLCFELHVIQFEATFLSTDHAGAERQFPRLAEVADGTEEIARVYGIAIQLAMNSHQDARALELVIEGLARLDYRLPKSTSTPRMIFELVKVQRRLKRFSKQDLLDLPKSDDPRHWAVQHILATGNHAAFRTNANMMVILASRNMNHVLVHGATPYSGQAMAGFALVLAAGPGDFRAAHELVEVAETLTSQQNPREYGPQATTVALVNGCFVAPRERDFEECREIIMRGYRDGVANGDDLLAYCCLMFDGQLVELLGRDAVEMRESYRACETENNRRMMTNWALVGTVSVAGITALVDDYRDDPSDLVTSLSHPLFEQDTLCAYLLHLVSMRTYVLMGNFAEAQRSAVRTREHEDQARGALTQLLGFFWSAIAEYECARVGSRRRHLRQARKDRKRIQVAVDLGNPLMTGLAAVLDAELLAVTKPNRRQQIVETYERALALFEDIDQRLMGAFAADRLACFLADDDPDAARALWQRSVDGWASCGCAAMAQRLLKRRLDG